MTGRIELGMAEEAYHSHPALSSTGARQLLKAPRKFQYAQDHPQPYKKAYDLGTLAHSKVLGTGTQPVVIPEELLASNGAASTKAAKEFIEGARAQGSIPVKQELFDEVNAMAEAILAHREARDLFEQEGDAEASVFATDPETGVEMRARFDFLPNFMQPDPWCVDLKTSGKNADAESFSKTVADFGYDVQEAHYLDTLKFATGDATARMKFVVVETDAPHLVAVHELSFEFAEIGAARARRARELFAQCTASGIWPGYDDAPLPLQPPLWHIFQNQELLQT